MLVDVAADALRRRAEALRLEQAVQGIDALDEVDLHPILASAYADAGLGVLREQPYPGEWRARRRTALPHRRDRQRCDLVLLDRPDGVLEDEVLVRRSAEQDRRARTGTLFDTATLQAPPGPTGTGSPGDAFWLEVKTLGQYCYTGGVPGPNRAYTTELTRGPIADLGKLASDPLIRSAGLLVVQFVAGDEVATHDQLELVHRCLDRELPIASPRRRSLPITDHIGNTACVLALIELRKV